VTPDEFQAFAEANPAVGTALQSALPATPSRSYTGITEAAALVLLFPLARFLLTEIGLPWLTTLERYSEVQRQRVERWIDSEAQGHGLDPDRIEEASKRLMDELEKSQDVGTRRQWERLTELLKQSYRERCLRGRQPRPLP
jgi:hypothetical protein